VCGKEKGGEEIKWMQVVEMEQGKREERAKIRKCVSAGKKSVNARKSRCKGRKGAPLFPLQSKKAGERGKKTEKIKGSLGEN